MTPDDLEKFEAELEYQLFREYRDVLPMFSYVVETERRFYLANDVKINERPGEPWVELELRDAWVWDMHRTGRFVTHVRVLTTRDVNVEELAKKEIQVPDEPA